MIRALILMVVFPFMALHDGLILLIDIARGVNIDED